MVKVKDSPYVSVIIVTHNSERFIQHAMASLLQQSRPADEVIIIDSGSKDLGYLEKYEKIAKIVEGGKEIGFCRANNIGMDHLSPHSDYVFFLNPDAFPDSSFLKRAVTLMEHPSRKQVGAVTGITLGYAIEKKQATGTYDTTGIFRTWYGKWYDRGQGKTVNPQLFQSEEPIPAICGAVFFARKAALDQVMKERQEVFDSSFFMYKEDIDLSLRLRKQGWELRFIPELKSFHCRGWNRDRKQMPRTLRLFSARNEWKIHWKERSLAPLLYSTLKLFYVKVLDR